MSTYIYFFIHRFVPGSLINYPNFFLYCFMGYIIIDWHPVMLMWRCVWCWWLCLSLARGWVTAIVWRTAAIITTVITVAVVIAAIIVISRAWTAATIAVIAVISYINWWLSRNNFISLRNLIVFCSFWDFLCYSFISDCYNWITITFLKIICLNLFSVAVSILNDNNFLAIVLCLNNTGYFYRVTLWILDCNSNLFLTACILLSFLFCNGLSSALGGYCLTLLSAACRCKY